MSENTSQDIGTVSETVAPSAAPFTINARFVPGKIVTIDGQKRLRGAIVLTTGFEEAIDPKIWPELVEAALASGVKIGFADPSLVTGQWTGDLAASEWIAIDAHYDSSSATSATLKILWPELMTRSLARTGLRPDVQAVIQAAGHDRIKGFVEGQHHINLAAPAGRSPQMPNAVYRFGGPAGGALRVTPARTSTLTAGLGKLDEMRLGTGINAAFARAGRAAQFTTTALHSALVHWPASLFSGPAAQTSPTRDLARLSPDAIAVTVITSIANHGIEAATAAADKRDKKLRAKQDAKPFDREPLSPRPRTALSTRMVELLIGVLKDNRVRAEQAHRDLTGRRTPAPLTDPFRSVGHPSGVQRQSSDNPADMLKAMNDAMASHMLAMRPGPAITGPAIAVDGITIDPHEAARILMDLQQTPDRRLFGILSYPPLARAMRLVVDVDMPLEAVPAAARTAAGTDEGVLVAVVVGSATVARLWTRSHIRGDRFTPIGRSETGGDPRRNERSGGIYNLGMKLANGDPRFRPTAFDAIARMEQLLAEARAQADRTKSGLERVDEASGASRSIGVAFLDSDRANAIQAQAQDADVQKTAWNEGRAVILHADDLSTGLRFDVGVQARKVAGAPMTWRSLMRRSIAFGPLDVDNGPSIDIEKLIDRAMKAAWPADPAGFRSQLDEASFKPAAKVVALHEHAFTDTPEASEIIAMETIGQWEGPPLGAPCGRKQAPDDDGSTPIIIEAPKPRGPAIVTIDESTDLPLTVEFDLPHRVPGLPPAFEIGRPFWFAARDAYIGGLGLSAQEADQLHSSQGMSLPALDKQFAIERHERIGTPVAARLASTGPARDGETLMHAVVRTAEVRRLQQPVSRRIIFAPTVPQAVAAYHPHPQVEGKRALDLVPPAWRRSTDDTVPAGGMVNVMVDPIIGGLAVRDGGRIVMPSSITAKQRDERPTTTPPPEGVFRVTGTDWKTVTKRALHHYPDPAIQALVLQLWTHGEAARPLRTNAADTTTRCVPIYSDAHRQALPDDWPVGASDQCRYPFAMPILLEVHAAQAGTPSRIDPPEVGTIDEDDDFRPLRERRDPPHETLTVQRVRVHLARGEEADLKVWGKVSDKMLGALAALNGAFPPADRSSTFANELATVPVPEHAEVLMLELSHAVQRPKAPRFSGIAVPALLRRDIADERWAAWLAEKPQNSVVGNWGKPGTPPPPAAQLDAVPHGANATITWLGGAIELDRRIAADITLAIRYLDARDEPGRPIPAVNGKPQFAWTAPAKLTRSLDHDPADPDAVVAVDLLRAGSNPRGLSLMNFDSRAYYISITPSSQSRFTGQMPRAPGDEALFEQEGDPWLGCLVATRRPDPMGKVEMLPAFVWEEVVNQRSRRTMIKLRWRRPRRGGHQEAGGQGSGIWYSSGFDEKLGIVLACDADKDAHDLGQAEPFISRWGADPIRDNPDDRQRPDWRFDETLFAVEADQLVKDMWMPLPGEQRGSDQPAGPTAAHKVDLLTFVPLYDRESDCWMVDIEMRPNDVATPILRLGLVRYQPHAKADPYNASEDCHVSQPVRIGFDLTPRRKVTVIAEPKDKANDVWPVRVIVSGPYGIVRGAAEVPDDELRERMSRLSRPRFKLSVLRRRTGRDGGGEDIVAAANSDASPPPAGDTLWETIVYLRRKPSGSPHYVFIEEVDEMLSANPADNGELVESGPRFMAKIRISARGKRET